MSLPPPNDVFGCVALPGHCIFRNRARMGLLYDTRKSSVGTRNVAAHKLEASRVSAYCREVLCEFPLDSRLLRETIVEELVTEDEACGENRYSTLTSFTHRGRSMVVHAGGKFMDQLIVRDFDATIVPPSSKSGMEASGFSIGLGRGEAIIDVMLAGKSNWNESSFLLARTRGELFSLKSTALDEFMAETRQPTTPAVIVEPLQKWQFPSELLSLSTFPTPPLSLALALCKDGQLYSWSPVEGVVPYSSPGALFPLWPSNREDLAALKSSPIIQYSSFHPMVAYASIGQNIHNIDLRLPGKEARVLHSGATACTALCQSDSSGSYLFVGSLDCGISLLDLRYPKQALAQRSFQGVAHKYLRVSPLIGNDILLLGKTAQHIFIHSINISPNNSPIFQIMSSYQPCSDVGCCWDTTMVPYPDALNPHVDIRGLDLIPVSRNIQVASECETYPEHHFMLLHQSSVGDVFAQRVVVNSGRLKQVAPSILPSGTTAAADYGTQVHSSLLANQQQQHLSRKSGLTLEPSLYITDLGPELLPSSSFLASAKPNGLVGAATTVLSTHISQLGAARRIDNEEDLSVFLDGALENCWLLIAEAPMTLWEIWQYILRNAKVDVNASLLRGYLRQTQNIREVLTAGIRPVSWTSDGMYVSVKPPQEASTCRNESDNLTEYACLCSPQRVALNDVPCERYYTCAHMHSLVYSQAPTNVSFLGKRASASGCDGESSSVTDDLVASLTEKW